MKGQAYTQGTSAHDLDYLLALPEIDFEQWQDEPLRQPQVERRSAVKARPKRRKKGQSMTGFAVVGALVISMLLLLVVLSHIQLTVVSSEAMQLERQLGVLTEESMRLQAAHEIAFHTSEVERFAREELGMVDAVRGQIVFLGSNSMDSAQVVTVPQSESQGMLRHLFGLLKAYIPFIG